MKQEIKNNIYNNSDNYSVSGDKAGFSAWNNFIKNKLTGEDDEKEIIMQKYKLISAQIQKQASKAFDTIEGRRYKNDQQNGARSFRIIQMLDEENLDFKYQCKNR